MKKNIILLFIFFIFLPSLVLPVIGQTTTPTETPTPTSDSSKDLDNVRNKIKDLENKVNSLQSEEKTLKSQIDVMDNQIALTELRISATRQELAELTDDIETASNKITRLEGSLDNITKVLLGRIVTSYKIGTVPPAQAFISSKSISHYITRESYLKIAQENDRRLLFDTQQARNDYQNQKDIYEAQQRKVVVLQKKLEEYNRQVETERKEKENLLAITKNDEAKYQSQLASARAELEAIEGVVSTIKLENGTPITKGQVIAVVGNTGAPYCSTGDHLHFEVRVSGADVNPGGYLKSGANWGYGYSSTDLYGAVNPSGDWDWPLDEKIIINQGYGSSHTYAKNYPDGIHHGFDMVSDSSALIRAPKDGTLYKGTTSCSGAAMNYVAIDHGGDVVSWYWHVR